MRRPDSWRRSANVLWRVVLDDAVLLCPARREPFVLSGGAGLWALLAEPRRVDELLKAMPSGQDPTTEKDLARLLEDLSEAGAVDWLPA